MNTPKRPRKNVYVGQRHTKKNGGLHREAWIHPIPANTNVGQNEGKVIDLIRRSNDPAQAVKVALQLLATMLEVAEHHPTDPIK